VDYRKQDFLSAALEATGGRGVDLVIDFVGGPYLDRNLRALAPGGRLIQVGILGGTEGVLPIDLLVHRHLRIIGTVMKSRTFEEKVAMTARFRERWHSAFREGALTPIVDRVFPLERADEAHRSMEASENSGKIILAMDEASHAKTLMYRSGPARTHYMCQCSSIALYCRNNTAE